MYCLDSCYRGPSDVPESCAGVGVCLYEGCQICMGWLIMTVKELYNWLRELDSEAIVEVSSTGIYWNTLEWRGVRAVVVDGHGTGEHIK